MGVLIWIMLGFRGLNWIKLKSKVRKLKQMSLYIYEHIQVNIRAI